MIRSQASSRIPGTLLVLLSVYCAASLVHFAHNAEFLAYYPNLPAWLTRWQVYASWLLVTSVGVAGVMLLKFGFRTLGFLLVAAYAGLGFAGLDHYFVAPMSAHTLAMNATIWFEVVAASMVFVAALAFLVRWLLTGAAIGE
jgi:hypothetical protein